jgi:hypothetical protein
MSVKIPRFGLNRFDSRSIAALAADVRRAETLGWDAKLKREEKVWPDFHHSADLESSGRVVDFLPEAAVDAFSLHGGASDIIAQLVALLRAAPVGFDHVVLHPIPDPVRPEDHEHGYKARVAREILPALRAALERT